MRQFIAPGELAADGSLVITGSDFRYLSGVLRLGIGDSIEVRLPSGRLVRMSVSSVKAKRLVLQPSSGEPAVSETGVTAGQLEALHPGAAVPAGGKKLPELWLFQFLPKAQKMDDIIRAATECGVAAIVPVLGAYSAAGSYAGRQDRWERIVREARQQSGSPVATRIERPVPLSGALQVWKKRCSASESPAAAFVLYEVPGDGNTSLFQHLAGRPLPEVIAVAVGAEGGISKSELAELQEAGFVALHFNTNILRAETAALYGIAVIQHTVVEGESWQESE